MNKGLFIHIIATIIGILVALFIVQHEDIGMIGRALIIALLVIANLIACAISDINNYYKQKL